MSKSEGFDAMDAYLLSLMSDIWKELEAERAALESRSGEVRDMVRRLTADDPWAAQRCAFHLEVGSIHIATAVALLACRTDSPGVHARFAEAFRTGDLRAALGSPELLEPRQWFRGLPAEVLDYIEGMAVSAVMGVHSRLDDLDDLDLDDAWWRCLEGELVDIDELNCLLVCLRAAGRGESPGTLLESLSERFSEFLDSLPVRRPLRNEQLRRAWLTNEWWSQPYSW